MSTTRVAAIVALILSVSPTTWGDLLVLDYSYDVSTDNFFSSTPIAKAAVDAAAVDVNALLTTTLAGITSGAVVGTNVDTTATFNWKWSHTNPSDGATVTIDPATINANVVTVYVGMRELSGDRLGQGGPGGVGYELIGWGHESEWVGAVANAATQSNTTFGRGGGPTIHTISNSSTWESETANYSVNHGSSLGHLWFDIDTDNNDSTDTAEVLAAAWHYDHTTDVASGKNDLYTVALHEMLHAIGIGTSVSWDSLVSDSEWTGPEVIAANGGSGNGLVDSDGSHIASDTMSTRLSDGVAQEAVMAPSVTTGTRKELTALDAAFLRDICWRTTAIPEPSAFLFVGLLANGCVARVSWKKWGRLSPASATRFQISEVD